MSTEIKNGTTLDQLDKDQISALAGYWFDCDDTDSVHTLILHGVRGNDAVFIDPNQTPGGSGPGWTLTPENAKLCSFRGDLPRAFTPGEYL